MNPSNAQYNNGVKSVTDFATGKAAMILNQNNAGNTISANGMTDDKFGVVAFPAPAAAPAKTASHVAGINMSIKKNTKNKDAALAFVNYMTSKDVQATLGQALQLPAGVEGRPGHVHHQRRPAQDLH